MSISLAHVINPVKAPETSDLFVAQPITFETMRRAKKLAKNSRVSVELYSVCFEEDKNICPNEFIHLENLSRSILDKNTFTKNRKLPFIADILEKIYIASRADYIIYTNVDIAIQKEFYIKVSDIIKQGYDAFVINRRTISNKYTDISEIEEMYQDKGDKHSGFDCFVFKRSLYPKFILHDTIIGTNWIGAVLISNLIMSSKKFKIFRDEFLTFHIGNDRIWNSKELDDYEKYNRSQYNLVANDLKKKHGKIKNFIKHYLAYKL